MLLRSEGAAKVGYRGGAVNPGPLYLWPRFGVKGLGFGVQGLGFRV